jgi:hypothetical protein
MVESWVNNPALAPFAGSADTLDWLRTVDSTYVKGVLSLLNGSLQGLDYRQLDFSEYETGWQHMSFEGGQLTVKPFDYIAPANSNRDRLFYNMVDAAKGMRDTTAIGQMGAVVLAEMQMYANANKRLARFVYGLAARGFTGTPQDCWDYAMAIYDRNPLLDINFMGVHNTLAGAFADKLTHSSVTHHIWPEAPNYEPVQPNVESPYLDQETSTFASYILNQSHFGLPVLMQYAAFYLDEAGRSECTVGNNTLLANKVVQQLTKKGFDKLYSLDGATKLMFVQSIISAYANGATNIYKRPIQEMLAPYMPPAPPVHRMGRFATADLVPIFSDYSSRV